jgi:ribose-phosphate pyrophosphokinase
MIDVLWMFENEAELITICQLGFLLNTYGIFPSLEAPWLPYGRQDKIVSNSTTFARMVFENLVREAGYTRIMTYDAHSFSRFIGSKPPTELIKAALPGHDIVCFPDKGAALRYIDLLIELNPEMDCVVCDKVRDQITGEITGLKFMDLKNGPVELSGCNVLVWDDLCDGGKTFTEVAKLLKSVNAKSMSLAVSHGIFSKDTGILFTNGYNKVYTTNSLMKYNKENRVVSGNLQIIEVVKL